MKAFKYLLIVVFLYQFGNVYAQDTLRIKVMTYNIRFGELASLEELASHIKSFNPDFVALQEIDCKTDRGERAPHQIGRDYISELAYFTKMFGVYGKTIDYKGGYYGIGILSRYPYIDTKKTFLPWPNKAHERRALLEGLFEIGEDTICFASTHLDYQLPKTREAQTAFITEHFNDYRYPVVLGGDFNTAPSSKEIKYSMLENWVAVQNKNQEMADYLKALEPEEWHNEQEKLRQLMPYKLPAKLVEYLKTGPLRLEFPDQEWVKWAELYSFMDVQEMTWKRKKLLSLMAAMDNYSDYLLLWSPRDKKLWYLDIEHEQFHPLAKWDDFIADPGRYLNGMIEGEFEE